ncbi:prelamin-A/C-like [Sparus aurata]|uniref:prelamin-A/C-like n=1 Tax=Sparus aurata TaxID=8175 RepID=UPI0011C1A791|nr:prelamin-A/C-like [Sparus aurata]
MLSIPSSFQTSNQENQEISASEEVILEEADPDGKFLRLRNKSGKIWASDGGGNHKPPTEVVWKDQKSWGATDKVLLITAAGEKKGLKL